MAKHIGRLVSFGIAKESNRGVGVAAAYWLPLAVLSYDDKVTKIRSALSFGTINQFGNQSLVAQKWAEGSIESDIFDKSFGLILLATLGTVSSGSFNSVYKHTFSLQNDNQHDSLTLHIDEPGADLVFELAMIEKMELTFLPNDTVKFKIDFKSKSSSGSVESAVFTAENKFLGRHLAFKIASLTSGLTAATAISLKSLKLTFTKNLVLDQTLGTVQPEDILNRAFNITGELMLDYEDRTYANLMLDGTYRAMRIDLVNSDITIGSTNPAFRIDLSRVDFDAWEPTRENDEIVNQKITFNALWDITNGNVINDCYLVNEQASY